MLKLESNDSVLELRYPNDRIDFINWMHRCGLTQLAAAKELGLHRNQIRKLYTGNVPFKYVYRLAAAAVEADLDPVY